MKHLHIRERLDNWAKWSRLSSRAEGSSMTGIVCDRMKKAAVGMTHVSMEAGQSIDEADANLVERAWRGLMPKHQQLLRWVYVRNANPGMICRRLGIKSWPASILAIEVSRAERAIEERLAQTAEGPATRGGIKSLGPFST